MIKVFEKILLVLVMFGTIFGNLSCDRADNSRKTPSVDDKQRKESVEEANRNLVKLEREIIDEYVKHSGLDFVETGTGLRYCIENQGEGDLIKQGGIVSMDYEMWLLNGEMLYNSTNDGLMTFMVGRGGVESGLEEAVLHLHKGDLATIVIPSHLAHGLIGDGKRVPPRSTLVYKVKIIEYQINK